MAVTKDVINSHIRFSTQIIRRLGEELNPSIDQSILELIKNAYDADAKTCTVELHSIAAEGGSIEIKDDGEGMDGRKIVNGWLVLGESSKNSNARTKAGRIPAGSKGLGRLAALRMGTVAQLTSIPVEDDTSLYEVAIDWDSFDKAKLVEDVNIPISKTNAAASGSHGTTIVIKNVKSKLGEREVKRLARGMILLADPFEDDPNAFKPRLKSPEFSEMEKLVARRYFDDADFHLVASVDMKGISNATIQDYRGNVLYSASHEDIARKRKKEPYNVPTISFDLWAFLLNETNFSTRSTSVGEVRAWLSEFGGIHLYENGLRVNPYGNPGNDWLDLNLARARSPEERPSTNNSIGVVRIRDSKGILRQKTDRSGFIESDVFHEIRQFCKDVLDWMAARRMEIAEQKRASEKKTTEGASSAAEVGLDKAINLLPVAKRKKVQKALTHYRKAKEDEIKTLRKEIQLYRTLSTAGITAATFSHESRGNAIKVLTINSKTLYKRIKDLAKDKFDELFSRPIALIEQAIESLSVLSNATLSLIQREKRRPVRVSINDVVQSSKELLQPFFDGRKIDVSLDLSPGDPYIRATEAAVESIVVNLLNNSIVALEEIKNRKIIVKTEVQGSVLLMTVSDNGAGIKGISVKDIWLPGETTNTNGTGLGLTIVRDTVHDLGGKVSAMANGELGGAKISVEIPIIGK